MFDLIFYFYKLHSSRFQVSAEEENIKNHQKRFNMQNINKS